MPSLIRLPLAAAMICLAGAAFANEYPAKPIRLIVPAAPGGGADFLARIVGVKLGGQRRVRAGRRQGLAQAGLDGRCPLGRQPRAHLYLSCAAV